MQAPSTANKGHWPPDYISVLMWRQNQLRRLRQDKTLLLGAKTFYRNRPAAFINHWCNTYDPRNAGTGVPARMPFILFQRQDDLVQFLQSCLIDEESGLIEKCRDMGATWVCAAFSVWLWMFWPGASVGWGSRKEQLVNKIGDPDSIFEKMRMLVRGIPREFWPRGLSVDDHMTYMKFVNPENGATITGESGDNIGRGGRKLIYFKDESAHYVRPEKIEAALADNTRVQIDISSVNGLGNVFHRRRESGVDWSPGLAAEKGRTRIFIMDWRDHPAKTDEWYNARKSKAEFDGLLHIFAQEVDRNYSASVDGTIIPSEWIRSAIDAHLKLNIQPSGAWVAALDVADGGRDTNAFAARHGIVLKSLSEWGAKDTGVTARKAIGLCDGLSNLELQYDCIGVGSGIKAEVNRLHEENKMPRTVKMVPWNAGASVQKPFGRVIENDKESPKNQDVYANLKAQAWWELRTRFYKTHKAVTDGAVFPPDDLISLDSKLPLLRQLEKELAQPTSSKGASMKLVVDKTPEGSKSPNLADAVVMAYWPITHMNGATVGTQSGHR